MSVEVPVHQSTPDGISGVRSTVVAGSGWLRALGSYLPVVDALWRNAIDYAQIIKEYGGGNEDHRYSPAVCTGVQKNVIAGNPDARHLSNSYVERQNLTMRMGMRRFTRLTNGFSKKVENHAHTVSLHFTHYNFSAATRPSPRRPASPPLPRWQQGSRPIRGRSRNSRNCWTSDP
jgi:hypothetical protein